MNFFLHQGSAVTACLRVVIRIYRYGIRTGTFSLGSLLENSLSLIHSLRYRLTHFQFDDQAHSGSSGNAMNGSTLVKLHIVTKNRITFILAIHPEVKHFLWMFDRN
jgi:hypothetical protein